jgi:SAM-dependent methyltransferase
MGAKGRRAGYILMTINYYQNHAQAFFADTIGVDMSSLYAPFVAHLAPGARVLDAGCGSGRDSRAFLEMGYEVEAFDASSEMVRMASQHSGLAVKQMTFSDNRCLDRYWHLVLRIAAARGSTRFTAGDVYAGAGAETRRYLVCLVQIWRTGKRERRPSFQ